jgi:hypothetical protein
MKPILSAILVATTATVGVTDPQGTPIPNYPFTLRALVRTNSGGHDHDVGRPTGRFVTGADTTVTVQDRTDAAGERQYRYLSSGFGGVDSLFVQGETERDTASATIVLKIADFEELTEGTHYRLIGSFGEPGVNSQHRKNHFGTTNLVSRLKALADSVHADSSYVLRFNDMSLQFGGPFDIRNNWNAPHQTHREGVSVDIDDVDANGKKVEGNYLKKWIQTVAPNATLRDEGNHFHAIIR